MAALKFLPNVVSAELNVEPTLLSITGLDITEFTLSLEAWKLSIFQVTGGSGLLILKLVFGNSSECIGETLAPNPATLLPPPQQGIILLEVHRQASFPSMLFARQLFLCARRYYTPSI